MIQMLNDDISNAIEALEHYIKIHQQNLIADNAGDKEWQDLNSFRNTLSNLKFLEAIYYGK